jgi:hypothetical protein
MNSLLVVATRFDCRALLKLGRAIDPRMAMIAMVIINSSKVTPWDAWKGMRDMDAFSFFTEAP